MTVGPGTVGDILEHKHARIARRQWLQKNKPSQLVFLVPNLVDGRHHLEIRTPMGSGTSAREQRKRTFGLGAEGPANVG